MITTATIAILPCRRGGFIQLWTRSCDYNPCTIFTGIKQVFHKGNGPRQVHSDLGFATHLQTQPKRSRQPRNELCLMKQKWVGLKIIQSRITVNQSLMATNTSLLERQGCVETGSRNEFP